MAAQYINQLQSMLWAQQVDLSLTGGMCCAECAVFSITQLMPPLAFYDLGFLSDGDDPLLKLLACV